MEAADRELCPGDNTVVELLGDGLAPERRAALGEHVDRCERCRELVAVMARSQMATSALGGRMRFARASEPPGHEGEEPHLRPGDEVGRYRIEEMIGQGGMGVVYAARDPELDRRVAVKLIRPGLAGYSDLVAARLSREARAMAQVAHPNVITVHDVGYARGRVFVAMELAAGPTLREWVRAEPRTWRQVLEVFRGAGEGLAAAHAARLVHRDFKPDNVLVSSGRARVTDFGLARALAGHDARDGESDAGPSTGASHIASEEPGSAPPLTRTGATVGTPAYMAPEQHAQLPTDERSDQFGFCVALWEALYGERPFAGETALELAEAVVSGRMRPPPRRPRLPAWLRRALVRGLSLPPEDRFPSMRALLDAIRPRRSRRLIVALAAALSIAGGVVAIALAGQDDGKAAGACNAAGEAKIASVWNDRRRGELRARLVEAGTPQAAARWQLVEASLDRYARGWRHMAADTCAAGERGEGSAELRDLRAHCLDTRIADLQQLTGLLDTSDPVVAENAIQSVAALPPIERCSAVEMVEARTPVPADPAERAKVDELRRELVRADALRLAGRYRESRALLEALRARAEAVGYRPLVADVLYYLGALEVSTGSASEGDATLRRAAHAAEAGRYDQLSADAWILLIETASQSTGDLERAAEYAEHARAALDRLGGHTRLEGQYEHHMGILEWARSRPDEALARFAAARRRFQQLGDSEMMLAADEGMALVHEDHGRIEEALRLNRGVLAARVKTFGPDHPQTALSLTNIASNLMLLGRPAEALAEMEKALAIRERTGGPATLETAQALHNIGELLRNLGRYPESLDHHRRSLEIFEREHGADHQMVATSLEHAGGVYLDLGRPGEALPRLHRALAIFRRTLGDDHLDTVRCRVNLADGLRRARRFGEALAHDREALAVMARGMGLDNLYAAHARLGVGEDLVGLRRLTEARSPLESAVASLAKIGGDPAALARAELGLARALWPERRSRGRARELGEAARDRLAGATGEDAWLRAQVAAWLQAHSR
jgi:eukaryotic-like serine/threonine-protein kinase